MLKNQYNSKTLRKIVLSKTKGKCACCDRKLSNRYVGYLVKDYMQIDHYIPKSKGGSDDIENLYPLCQPCKSRKSSFLFSERLSLLCKTTDDTINKLSNNTTNLTEVLKYMKNNDKRNHLDTTRLLDNTIENFEKKSKTILNLLSDIRKLELDSIELFYKNIKGFNSNINALKNI